MYRFFVSIYPLTLLLFSCLAAAEDQLAMLDLDEDFLDELPIVLSATRLAQPMLESPVATSIINRSMIEASGARTIPDILRLVPGFQVGYFDGNSPVATYHGHSAELATGLQVLIDGRSVYIPSRNAVPWSDLVVSIDNIEKIEVIRGPNAASYGNNSFLAVISITTRHASETQGSYARLRGGNFNTADALYQYGDRIGKLDYRISIGSQNDSGTRYLTDYTESDFISYRMDYQYSLDDNLSYQGGYKDILLGDHEPAPNSDPYAGHDIANTSAFQLIKWEHQINNLDNFSLQYYYNLNKSLEVAPLDQYGPEDFSNLPAGLNFDPFQLVLNMYIKSERHDLEFNHYFSPSDALRIVWGGSVRLDRVTASEGLFDQSGQQNMWLYRGFANIEWRISEEWLLNSGLMVEDNDISGNAHSPRLAFIYKISPVQSIRFNYSNATRTPTLFEEAGKIVFTQNLTLNGSPIPNLPPLTYTRLLTPGNLQAERITSHELGYYAQLAKNKLQLDIKLFDDHIRNILDITRGSPIGGLDLNTGPIELIENANSTRTNGAELAINYQINDRLNLYAFFSHIHIENTTIKEAAETQDYSNSAPRNSGGLMLNKYWPNDLSTSLIYYNVGNMRWGDRTDERAARAYQKVDIRIAKTYQQGDTQLEISLVGQNLYENFADYNTPTFNADGSLNLAGSLQERKIYLNVSLSF